MDQHTSFLPATAQEVFDTVARHLFTQGRQSYSPTIGGCAYRGPDGLKCAVGHLIPDEIYQPDMDRAPLGLDELIMFYPGVAPLLDQKNLLIGLQDAHDIHDNWASTDAMRRVLTDVAERNGLSPAVLDGLVFNTSSATA